MADERPPNPDDEEALRQAIRKEIEERERLRRHQSLERESAARANAEAEKRRRIYQEEMRRYYQNKPGYREITREDGEVDWVPETEARRDAALFDEVLEDPDVARKRMKYVLLLSAAGLILLAGIVYAFLHESTGSLQVVANVTGARVIVDADTLDEVTDALLKEVPAGEHYVTVALEGYRVLGEPIRRVELKGGRTAILQFNLAPAAPDSTAGR